MFFGFHNVVDELLDGHVDVRWAVYIWFHTQVDFVAEVILECFPIGTLEIWCFG